MPPWEPLFAFERASITSPDCSACKQMQAGSVYICTLPDRVFPLALEPQAILRKQGKLSVINQRARGIHVSRREVQRTLLVNCNGSTQSAIMRQRPRETALSLSLSPPPTLFLPLSIYLCNTLRYWFPSNCLIISRLCYLISSYFLLSPTFVAHPNIIDRVITASNWISKESGK